MILAPTFAHARPRVLVLLGSQEALCQRAWILQNTLSLQLCLLPGVEGPGRGLPVAPSTAPWPLHFPAHPQLDLLDALLDSQQPWAGKAQDAPCWEKETMKPQGSTSDSGTNKRHACNSYRVHSAPGMGFLGQSPVERQRVLVPDTAWLHSPIISAQALLDLLLLYGLVASMVLIWQPINKLAALLLLPYLAWLTVTTAITYRLWRDSLCPAYQP